MTEKEEPAMSQTVEEIERKIKSELEPFLDGIRTKRANYELFKQAYNDFRKRFKHAEKIAEFIGKEVAETAKSRHVRSRFEIDALLLYLGYVESLGNCIVDIVTMLLVANGRDFHIECMHPPLPRIRHAVSMRDLEIERVSLTAKLNFLEGNGITKLASVINSRLRNDIAHLKFTVEKDQVYIRGQPALNVVMSNFGTMIEAINITDNLLTQLATEKGWVQEGTRHE
jgi:hypothetical protein